MSKLLTGKQNRLLQYDYSETGYYYLTICTDNRKHLFGDICRGRIFCVHNHGGDIAQRYWEEIPEHYPDVDLDRFIVMDSHIHCIINIVGSVPCACPDNKNPGYHNDNHKGRPRGDCNGQPRVVAPTVGLSLSDVVHRFKTMTTKRYCDGVKNNN